MTFKDKIAELKSLKNFVYVALITSLITAFISITVTLSYLRTTWEAFQIDFFFWWSILSTLAGIIFIVVSIWQYWESKSQQEKNKAQVKVWMQDANGLRNALQRIVKDNLDERYSSTNDMGNAIWSVEATASALYQSLYEERCVTEEEYRERQKKISDLLYTKQYAELEDETSQTKGVR